MPDAQTTLYAARAIVGTLTTDSKPFSWKLKKNKCKNQINYSEDLITRLGQCLDQGHVSRVLMV